MWFIVVWFLCSVLVYTAFSRFMWSAFGDVLGWKWSDTFSMAMLALTGPVGALPIFLFLAQERKMYKGNHGIPFKPRLPRDQRFHYLYKE